jgi:hypothetical protein
MSVPRVGSARLCATCADLAGWFEDSQGPSQFHRRRAAVHDVVDHLAERARAGSEPDGSERCGWCAREAGALNIEVTRSGRVLVASPVLCRVCAGLAGITDRNRRTVNERRGFAVELLRSELAHRRAIALKS